MNTSMPGPDKEPSTRRVAELERRLVEAEDTLDAIRSGAVDALVVRTPRGERLFTLKGADQTYRALVQAMSEGAVTLKNGIISYCNRRFAEMLRMRLESVLGSPISQLIHAPGLPGLLRRLQRGAARRGSMEAELHGARDTRVPVLLAASRFSSDGETSIGLVITDISRRKRAEAALRASEERFQIVARTANDAIWDWDIVRGGTWRSPSLALSFGYPLSSINSRFHWWSRRIHPHDRPAVLAGVRASLEGTGNVHRITYRFRRHDGTYAHVSDRSWIVRDEFGKPVRMIGALRDISVEREAELARRELSRRIINAQEHERQRVARDLHDGVNQLLSSAKYRLSSALAQGSNSQNEDLRQVFSLVEKAIHEVRLISRNLRPSELDDLGLVAALRSLAHDHQKRSGINARFRDGSLAASAQIPKEVEMALYRIAQEALNNVEKHSNATRVDMVLRSSGSHVLLTVQDNGTGLRRRVARNGHGGWGLQNMEERTELLGGSFKAGPRPEGGTEISIQIPLPKSPEHSRRKSHEPKPKNPIAARGRSRARP